jgi:hypothetical protein
MVVVLPMTENSTLHAPPSHGKILGALSLLHQQRIALALPKFRFQTTYESDQLSAALNASGLTLPFQSASFCGLVEEICLNVDKVIQKTSIHVHELGTTAAAVTVVTMVGASPSTDEPILFQADHPFFFYIVEQGPSTEEDGLLVLFEGYVSHPFVPEEAFPPTLTAKHSDDDFWTTNLGLESNPATVDPNNGDDNSGLDSNPVSFNSTVDPNNEEEHDIQSSGGATPFESSWPELIVLCCVLVLQQILPMQSLL